MAVKRVKRFGGVLLLLQITNDHLGFHHRHHGAWGWPEARLTLCIVSSTECTALGEKTAF